LGLSARNDVSNQRGVGIAVKKDVTRGGKKDARRGATEVRVSN
jgi:hypothetical protein